MSDHWPKRIIMAVLASMMLIPVFIGTPAQAETAADRQAVADQNDIVSFDLVTGPTVYDPGTDPFTVLSAAGNGCGSKAHEWDGKNAFGKVIAKVGFSLHICWKNGNVVSKNWGPPWCWTGQFPVLWNCQNGDTYIEDQSNQNLPRAYIWRQYRFHLHYCVTWICKDQWPWVYIGGRGDGTFGVNGGRG